MNELKKCGEMWVKLARTGAFDTVPRLGVFEMVTCNCRHDFQI